MDDDDDDYDAYYDYYDDFADGDNHRWCNPVIEAFTLWQRNLSILYADDDNDDDDNQIIID